MDTSIQPLDTKNWSEFEQDGYRIKSLGPFRRFRGLDIPWDDANGLEDSTERVVKCSRSRKVVKLSAGQFGLPVEVYIKRYNLRTWLKLLLRTVRKSRAREEFDLGWRLIEMGIQTPRPVWLAEAKGAMSRFSMLATEALPDVESAQDRWKRLTSDRLRMDLVTALGRFTWRMHEIGFYHDDFKSAHLLIFPNRPSVADEFYVIDLLGGEFPKVLTPLSRAKNLYQLIRSFCPKRSIGFTQEYRHELLRAYCGSKTDVDSWSNWVDRVGRLKGQRI